MGTIININGTPVDTSDIVSRHREWGDRAMTEAYLIGMTGCTDEEASSILSGILKGGSHTVTQRPRHERTIKISSASQYITINGVRFTPAEIYEKYARSTGDANEKKKQAGYYIGYKANLDMTLQKSKDDISDAIQAVLDFALLHEADLVDAGSEYTPRCPVCGSPNIKKISSFAKYLNLKTAGLNSATLNKQMECKSCGYMF